LEPQIPETPARVAYLRLVVAYEQLVAPFEALFRERGMTKAQFNVLRVLIQAPEEGLPCLEIGRRLIHRQPDVTRLIDRMERAGLVERQRSGSDRRKIFVRLTPLGRETCLGFYADVSRVHEEIFAHVDEPTLQRLGEDLEAVIQRDPAKEPSR
jgi:DNA-binding MarR family transcriptional regulator